MKHLHVIRRWVLLALLLAGSAHLFASPRTLPKEQASHFCRLLFYDGEGSVRLLNTYAQNLVTVLCGQPRYGDYTAEQVFTGLIFYFDNSSMNCAAEARSASFPIKAVPVPSAGTHRPDASLRASVPSTAVTYRKSSPV